MDYRSVLYGPIYATQGVPARLTLPNGAIHDDLTAIDKTAGLQLAGIVEIETLRPLATMLVGDLLDRGVSLDDLDDSTLNINEIDWKIIGHRTMPTSNGEADGEVYLMLEGIAGG